MFERIIVIIDDNKSVTNIDIPLYENRIAELKLSFPEWSQYKFLLRHINTMQGAKEYLQSNNVVDVIVVDHDFNGERTFENGTDFIKFVRSNVNKQCRIIFYTMQGKSTIDTDDLISLINADVYKMIDKSDDISAIGDAIFEAATKCDPVVMSLERFFDKYKTLLSSYKYSFSTQEMSLDEVINHIRMDDDLGRVLIDKLLQRAIMMEIEIKDK